MLLTYYMIKRINMNLAVLQLKGGVGKTPLSFSLAKDLGLNGKAMMTLWCHSFTKMAKY